MQIPPDDSAILYLEDEIIISLDTSQTLSDMGFSPVHVATNLRRAEALAQKHDGALSFALLDVNIAGEGLSLDFGRALLAQGVEVVFASGYNRNEMEAEHEGLTFVEKPLNADVIADGFERVKALSRSMRAR